MTFGSCYTGAAGFDLGLVNCGWTCRWQVEADPVLLSWLSGHWPGVTQRKTAQEAVRQPPGAVQLIYGEVPCGLGWPAAREPTALALGCTDWLLIEGAPAPWHELRPAAAPLLAAGWHVTYRVVRYVTSCATGRSSVRQRVWMLAARTNDPTAVCDAMGLDPRTLLDRPASEPGVSVEVASTPIHILEAARGFPVGWMAGLDEITARRALAEAASPWLGQAFAMAMREVRCAPAA